MNKEQLTELVIIPTLKEIPKGYSEEAVIAIQMIIAHESSGGEYIAQTKGPALGVIQMEPMTHDDVWNFGDSIHKNARLMGLLNSESDRLVYDLRYNVFMARQKLFMAAGALPSDLFDMSEYLKKNWNGPGKATPEKYLHDFMNWK
ncbi:MAG: hypothetical protein Unbinned1520contig1002_45 [Prokaryotic dsDNA virus sp.]|nr:MAG: hypothetical protein Unbinned1520contig1002_45 [Prokaryotic dsDNA virus sp.]|tara:strand:+ start:12122 stop:12559 length:438 start_codon:yes stop_codon:yes gene_type:complete